MAIGRSIIRDTQILLFDEPLSNLDTVRMRMRLEIARMCDRLDATMVHVTHDQTEAMTLADRIVVFNHGRIEQIGAPVDLYDASASLFVAGSIGAPAMNFIPAVVESPDGHVKQVRFGVAADEAHARSIAGAGHVRRPPGASCPLARQLGTGTWPWYRHSTLTSIRHRPAGSRDLSMSHPILPSAAVDYPSSDGKPLAENDAQLAAILYAVSALRVYYAARADVYVSGDLLIYYEESNPRVAVAPDAFVVFGVEDRVRMNYKVWEEGKGPEFVLEVASRSTWREDVGRKLGVYAELGVTEYFLYDPRGEYLAPRLQGHRLVGGVYEGQVSVESIDRTLTLRSETLGLELRVKGGELRFHDPATGRNLLSHHEEHIARRKEAAARRMAESRAGPEPPSRRARIAELEALLGGRRR